MRSFRQQGPGTKTRGWEVRKGSDWERPAGQQSEHSLSPAARNRAKKMQLDLINLVPDKERFYEKIHFSALLNTSHTYASNPVLKNKKGVK